MFIFVIFMCVHYCSFHVGLLLQFSCGFIVVVFMWVYCCSFHVGLLL